ncbi:MAG TPA: hypothetical protein VIS07_18395 [Candidatus Binatia bacterium]
MAIGSAWHPLTPDAVDRLPEAMAVFEIGNLVRSVLYIGGDPNETLRSAVRRALDNPKLRLRARCIRWELTTDPRTRAQQLLAAYRAAHGGALPPEQPRSSATVHALVPPVAETRPAAPSAPIAEAPVKRPVQAASFLRVRTVA